MCREKKTGKFLLTAAKIVCFLFLFLFGEHSVVSAYAGTRISGKTAPVMQETFLSKEQSKAFSELSTESIAREVLSDISEDSALMLMSFSEDGQEKEPLLLGKIMIYAGETPLLITEEEKEILLRIVEAEATCEDVMGRMLVANVVLNRVLCKGFPNSIEEVVFQHNGPKYQFSPLSDGRYWKVRISEKTKEAVERVINGEDESQGALFFAARSMANPKSMSWFDTSLKKLFKHGVHEFFTVK